MGVTSNSFRHLCSAIIHSLQAVAEPTISACNALTTMLVSVELASSSSSALVDASKSVRCDLNVGVHSQGGQFQAAKGGQKCRV